MAEEKIEFGLEKVHIAFLNTTSLTPPEWGTPIPIPGAVNILAKPEGEKVVFYADNGAYFVMTANNGYSGDLEMARIPNAVLAEMLGWEIDNNGMLVEITDGKPKEFALMGQFLTDKTNTRFVYYNCIAARPSDNRKTKTETIAPDTTILPITSTPIEVGGKTFAKGILPPSETNKTVYDAFFNSVYLPAFGTGA